ncbi:bifunctional diaminohydroxyphosphoribosylaminopyrimidine deaminase/5-amino-6-(5-phosphoribosylamino)uracil reductase RibD [Guggenheimella bovis]
MNDEEYMRRALELAKKGLGRTSPNPLVGCVVVRDGVIIGEGYHKAYGMPHAEREALKSIDTEDATLYVTLEPCCHEGKQPPCTDLILEKKVSRVVVGSLDPNPLVQGKGIEILRSQGIEVMTDVLKEECDQLNEIFFHYITKKMPFVACKMATSLDGKIATSEGKSKWITSDESRLHAHSLRNRYSAIMVGITTVLKDNPSLTCRISGGRNPIRIICDTSLRTPLDSEVVQSAKEVRTIIATCFEGPFDPYEALGVEILRCKKKEEKVDLKDLLEKLGALQIDSILVEGGASLHASFLKEGLAQKVYTYIAPLLFGSDGKSSVSELGVKEVRDGIRLKTMKTTAIGNDIFLESEVLCLQES